MPCYAIARIEVTDAEDYAAYASQTMATAEPFGAEFLVKGGEAVRIEGEGPTGRLVVIRFPDRAAAEGWYRSEAYRAILPIALRASRRDIVFVEGV